MKRYINEDLKMSVNEFSKQSGIKQVTLNSWINRNHKLALDLPIRVYTALSGISRTFINDVLSKMQDYEEEWLAVPKNHLYFVYTGRLEPINIAEEVCLKIGDRSISFETTSDGLGYIFDSFTLLKKEDRWILLNNDTDTVVYEQVKGENVDVDKVARFIGKTQ
ncbi:hypothetical protein [Secundilactobacillus oryzae]|uniref:hypothetical protein n=1 Tax=Secundilactobacillus oryzae TaxID=1202668 RepID=UPI0006D00601|nr:hypothetical protein [Secundilactobacillus oryzae]